jgi:tetraacyldisaccharide 4'-kinase
MREPAFWWRKRSGGLLAPLAAIYGAVAWARIQAQGRRAGVPVICLGNLTVGGAGKTPAALAVAHLLLAVHERPFFLSRGYGGKLTGPVRVDPAFHHSADVGDEPLMLARLAPTIVARDRTAGARMARSAGSSVIVMDDGFQNPSLVKDLAILLVDGRRGIGNGRVIPAGPLRAPLEIQIARAQALVVVGPPDGAAKVLETARRHGVAVFHGRLAADRNSLAALGKRKVLAFAGIGNPEKFFTTLTEAGVDVAERSGFPDHHRYTAADAQRLMARAQTQNLMLITTEKDYVRLAGDPALAALKAHASILPVRLVVDEQEQFRQLVLGAAKRH